MAIIPANEKVFMVSNNTNTTYSGSAALQAMQQWYTMQDISDSIQPYKVFTALLTQTGSDSPNNISTGDLVIGVSYRIEDNSGNPDFTTVGAPNNLAGTRFIATGITPNWGDDGATLSFNDAAPVATVLQNTFEATPSFVFQEKGVYLLRFSAEVLTEYKTIPPPLKANETMVFNRYIKSDGTGFGTQKGYSFYQEDTKNIFIKTFSDVEDLSNDILEATLIEVKVYN